MKQLIYNTSEESKEISNLYNSRLSFKDISRKINISESTIRKRLIKAGIKIRPIGARRVSLNESVFETMTSESAYWVGMLLADGNLYKQKHCNSYQINYASKDKEHVEKFKKFLNSGHKIFCRKYKNKKGKFYFVYTLTVCSKIIYNSLIDWSLTPCKSTKEKVNSTLKYNRDFWRGMFDGDGCFSRTLKTGGLFCYLAGSYSVISDFKDFFSFHNIKHCKIRKTDSIYRLNISSEREWKKSNKGIQLEDYIHICKFYSLLYKDASIYLNRKYTYFI